MVEELQTGLVRQMANTALNMDQMLSRMTSDERRKLYDYLDMQFSTGGTPEITVDEQMVVDIVREAIMARGVKGAAIFPTLIKSRGWTMARFRRLVGGFLEYVDAGSGRQLRRIEREALVRLMVDCLIDYMSDKSPLTLSSVVGAMEHTASAVDTAFPGYYEARMLRFLVRRAA